MKSIETSSKETSLIDPVCCPSVCRKQKDQTSASNYNGNLWNVGKRRKKNLPSHFPLVSIERWKIPPSTNPTTPFSQGCDNSRPIIEPKKTSLLIFVLVFNFRPADFRVRNRPILDLFPLQLVECHVAKVAYVLAPMNKQKMKLKIEQQPSLWPGQKKKQASKRGRVLTVRISEYL